MNFVLIVTGTYEGESRTVTAGGRSFEQAWRVAEVLLDPFIPVAWHVPEGVR